MTEALVMQFLTRFRGSLTAVAYTAMIDAGRSSLLDELNAFSSAEPVAAPAPVPAKKRGRKKKAEPVDHEEVTTEQVLSHLQILGETLSSTEITAALSEEMNRPVSIASVSKAIKQLLKQKLIVQHGQRRGAKYAFGGMATDTDDASVKARMAEDEDTEPAGG